MRLARVDFTRQFVDFVAGRAARQGFSHDATHILRYGAQEQGERHVRPVLRARAALEQAPERGDCVI